MAPATQARAARMIAGGSALVAGAVLSDSTLEHYRGSFENRAMVVPLVASTLSIGAESAIAAGGVGRASAPVTMSIHAASAAAGAVGMAFHIYNVAKQPGSLSFSNFFYQAPIGAPAALLISGALGAGAQALLRGASHLGPVPLASGRVLAGATALGLAGAAGEAALLHFRGAYHNPAMWLPVSVVPVAALLLARAAVTARVTSITSAALAATAALGLAGTAFHAYGVSRNMGGWRNWRQNLLAGPPLPAPPSFTGLAIAGLGALMLLKRYARA